MMCRLPDFLRSYEKKAQAYLAQGCVHDAEFFGRTYQVQILDLETDRESWVFLQLDAAGQLEDSFCSGEQEVDGEERAQSCVHIAVAFLWVYRGGVLPLHERFELSLWNQLCRLSAEHMGGDPSCLDRIDAGIYEGYSSERQQLFFIKGKTAEAKRRIDTLILQRPPITETSSLKFSNISSEELRMWKEGRPTPRMQYALSFWYDLAQQLMALQDANASCRIEFLYSDKDIPCFISIHFLEIEVGFYLSLSDLSQMIPSLSQVPSSPLQVYYQPEDAIRRILYDSHTRTLLVEPNGGKKREGAAALKNSQSIGGWLYVPRKGFYSQEQHELLAKRSWNEEEIPALLTAHSPLIATVLEGTRLHRESVPLSFALSFDAEWNLHIRGYLFKPGDLTQGLSHFFGSWAYIEGDGFYPVERGYFPDLDGCIPYAEVADFVHSEKNWLNFQEGFCTHLSSVESAVSYQLTSDSRLKFEEKVCETVEGARSRDFGEWIYIEGKGFYPKRSLTTLPLGAHLSIPAYQVSSFIQRNREELKMVGHFFSRRCPVVKIGLNLAVQPDDSVRLWPQYQVATEYEGRDVRFFEDYVYAGGEGFSELPPSLKLPERFRQEVIIARSDLAWFFSYDFPKLESHFVSLDPRAVYPVEMQLLAKSVDRGAFGEGTAYGLKLGYQTERGFIPLSEICWGMQRKREYLFSEAGLVALGDRRFDWVRRIPKKAIHRKTNILHLSTLELMRLMALEHILTENDASRSLLDDLENCTLPEAPDLSGLKGKLRPYQLLGVRWLWFLYLHGLSGLLCDDMGLGKTHQAMAVIAAVLNSRRTEKKRARFLVVCPTSVICHWEEKLTKFFPKLKVLSFYGSGRNLEDFKRYDLLLTSYGVLRQEYKAISRIPFEIAIFDEIQIAKNVQSRINTVLRSLKAYMRLGLTGTPMENYLRELKSLFDIILPTYMPSEKDYRELFIKPIEKGNDRQQRSLLKRLIHPFMLRRKKEDVLPDLPEKTEEVVHCHFFPAQRVLYHDVLHRVRDPLLEQLEDSEAPVPYVHIFSLLSKLKQICNHPAAYLKVPSLYKEYESGKWELFVELFEEARASRQKVVIFSQYLAMLDILVLYMEEIGLEYAMIRGSTRDRAAQINRFNRDPSCEVFIGSLMTTGLGVDLTAASVVVHYDRWWNAAREQQATDRVHRIGQTRGVQVFKLVTKGSFEERIDELIEHKRQLFENVVAKDDHRILKQLDRKELIQLLQDSEIADWENN